MRIVRDYKEYELTPKELRLAYEEQQAIYDRQNIRDNLDWILDGETKYIIHGKAKSIEQIRHDKAIINAAAKLSREKQDDGDMAFSDAIKSAVTETLKRMEGK